MSANNSSASNARENPTVQEYTVRVPKNPKKKLSVMRFHSALGVDFTQWSQVKMERENNMAQFKTFIEEEQQPKFGAGSEYGRQQREEARRRKYTSSKKYRPEDQPWLLNVNGKTGKKYKGVREGGVAENASYYVFTQAPDGAFEAFPVEEWYNFQPIQRYKALSAEEAEEEFSRRNRTLNLFSLMVRKRLKNEDGEEADGEEGVAAAGKKKKSEGRFSDMEDFMESSGGDSSGEEEKEDEEDDSGKGKKGKKGKAAQKKKKKRGSDDEGGEDSDDGDGEGREIDYISSSESESDMEEKANNGLKGVAEEDGLRKLLNSDEEDEEEEEENKEEEEENEEEEKEEQATASTSKDDKNEKKKKNKDKDKEKKSRKEDYGSSSDSGPDSSDAELEKSSVKPPVKVKGSAESSRSTTPTKAVASALAAAAAAENGDGKAKGSDASPPAKRQKVDSSASGTEAMIEEAVRRYLTRKPMTTTELLQKFKTKRTGLTSDQMVQLIAQILKRINLNKQMVKGKMYLSIKSDGAK